MHTFLRFIDESTNMDNVVDVLKSAIKGSYYEQKLYIVGGFVRNELLGEDPKDIDVVVEGGPDAGMDAATFIAKKLEVYKPESNPVLFPTYGTAKLSIPVEGKSFDVEFVAPRKERYEPGSRKPSVSPGTLRDDALRRDFTINALFKNLMTGEILDLSGRGLKDLKDRVLNTTGDADWIFSEDPLRILRAVRFTLKYNLRLPLTVIRAIKKAAPSLANISAERIQDELKKILVLSQPSKAIRLFKMTGILDQILPELKALDKLKQNKFHTKDALGHTLDVLDNTPANFHERLAALFHDIGKAATRTEKDDKVQFIGHAEVGSDLTQAIMKRLKYSNEDIQKVSRLVKYHMDLKSTGKEAEGLSEKTLRKFVYRVAAELEPLLNLIHADNISHTPEASMPKQIEKVRERIAALNIEEILNTQSVLDGNEIMALGAKGKLIGEIKNRILAKTIENPEFTKQQAVNLAQNMINSSVNK